MAYTDALQDTVTISTVSTDFKVGDKVGEEEKTFTPLYTNVACRLMSAGRVQRTDKQTGSFESFANIWLIQMAPEFNGANRGDRAVVNGQTYLITKKHEIRGDSATINHVVYYLEEKE
jgi:hypothetical protein